MVENGFDFHELDEYTKKLLKTATNDFPRETKNFMGRSANRLAKNVKDAYKNKVRQKTGNLVAGVKKGRPYVYGRDEFSVRVKNTAPHAHLIEHGHVYYHKGKPTNKFVKGKNIVGAEVKKFESNEFGQMAETFVDLMLNEGKL